MLHLHQWVFQDFTVPNRQGIIISRAVPGQEGPFSVIAGRSGLINATLSEERVV
jgi:hypothetical protein